MNKKSKKLSVSGVLITALTAMFSQQALADSVITSNYSYGEGDYYIVDIYGNGISDFSGGSSGGGTDFSGYSFPPTYNFFGQPIVNNSSGYGGGDLILDLYNNDHNFTGSGGAGAQVLDPSSQLSFIQIDGESVVDLSFSITTPHTYTLTGNLIADDPGRVDLSFGSSSLSDADGVYALSGTLAAGEYSLLINALAALDSPGTAFASFDFDLQLYEVATVPLPAAIWLFTSGLIGLIGISRRNTTTI